MSITTALRWRYATKRMTGHKIPVDKMDIILNAISLAPSSFGLQPYTVLVIENKAMLEKIKPIAMMQPQITEASALVVFAVWDKITSEKINNYIQKIIPALNVKRSANNYPWSKPCKCLLPCLSTRAWCAKSKNFF